MTKKSHRRNDDFYGYEEDYAERGYHEELKERRKQKRMKNAIRSRNVDDLMRDLDDDYDFY